ncbi:hypothetical protein PPL_07875 [Heterostelium album PN500]|uniref:Chromatin assembly factor 1 subunit A dimerization domain-containing protein n=1 Tax=Heterostelium pallidum (strain ATCC 26659 / Pp 5 / PN500) TaxID=670386 RepID=D3BH73_HETP5|nr:hypothetical protein PPL_07875 [Heterostelium album PN500]EFA79457.1 hypothetical protein PPL_07875 [Heterostelium album PN500]|eukprot:XP_020431578.1 hypothetical protein PPL_07875 [Heterostelium album PN500]
MDVDTSDSNGSNGTATILKDKDDTTMTDVNTNDDHSTSSKTTTTASATKKRKKLSESEIKEREDEKRRKQQEKEEEKKKRDEEKKKKEEEKKKRDEEKELEKKKRDEEKKLKDEEKKKKDEERELEKKRRDEEKKQKEEEREQMKRQKDDEKKQKEEERKKKEEERELVKKQKEEEKRKMEEELSKKQSRLTQFFNVVTPDAKPVRTDAFIQPVELAPFTEIHQFQVRPDFDRAEFEQLIEKQSTPLESKFNGKTYFRSTKLKSNKYKITSLPGAIINDELLASLSRLKLLKFHDSRRPSYYGTYSKPTKVINGRKPFAKDNKLFDYSYDSGDEWEEEEAGPADNISSDEESEEEEEDEEEDKNWIESDNEINSDHESHPDVAVVVGEQQQQQQQPDITSNQTTTTRKKKKRVEKIKKKRIIIIDPSNEATMQTENLNLFNRFPVESLVGGFPISISKLVKEEQEALKLKEKKEKKEIDPRYVFPLSFLPTVLKFVMDNKKKSVKTLGKYLYAANTNVMKKIIIEKIQETCLQTNGVWSVKPEFEDQLKLDLDDNYILPVIPVKVNPNNNNNTTSTPNKNSNNNNNNSTTSTSSSNNEHTPNTNNSESSSLSKKKCFSPKKKPQTPVQTNSLLSYFSKVQSPIKTNTTTTTTNTEGSATPNTTTTS